MGLSYRDNRIRGVAQWLSASALGAESRGFDPLRPDHFFARILGKKITKPQGFTSRFCVNKSSSLKTEGFLHIFTKLQKPCLLRHSFHSLVKSFRYRFTCEVAACRREDVFLFTAHLTVLK